MNRRTRTSLPLGLATVVLLVGATACTSPSHSSSKAAPKPAATKAASTVPVVQNPLPSPSAISNNVAARKNVSISACAKTGDGWGATGTATNPGASERTYAITVFFTTDKATVQDFSTTRVTVKPGASATWTASKKFAASSPTLCVLRGVA